MLYVTTWALVYALTAPCCRHSHRRHVPFVFKVEIDEYRDYEKALGALTEAVNQLTKAGSPGDKLTQLNKRIRLLEK